MGNEADRLLPFVQAFEIDSQLLALFVEVAAFESEGFGSLSDVPVVPLQFPKHFCTLKARNPLCERAGGVWIAGAGGFMRGVSGRQRELDGLGIDHGSGQKQEPLDDIAQLPNIAGPRVLLERLDSLIGKGYGLPSVLRADLTGKVLDQ